MVHHLQPPSGSRKPSAVWRCAGPVLTLGALLSTAVALSADRTLSVSRIFDRKASAEPARTVELDELPGEDFRRNDSPRDDNYGSQAYGPQTPPAYGPQTPPADPSPYRYDERDTPPVPQEIPLPSDRPRSREFDRMSPHGSPRHRPEHRRGHEEDNLPERELIQRKLTVRYGNPAVVRLVRSLSTEQGLQIFAEVSILIDSRHLKPSTYDARVKQAAKNLLEGLENRAFLRANGLDGDPSRTAAFRSDIQQLGNSHPISGRDEAYQALRWTMRAAEEHAGMRPATVVLEFIHGSTDSLDKYSGFVPTLDRASPSVELEDHIVGVGVEIKPDERGMLVVNALTGSPAAEAGVRKGDLIESVNGQPVAGETLEAAVNLITGPPGSRVTLGVRREEQVSEVPLVRRRVEVHSVSEVKMLENNVGYIKLDKFAQNSSEECDRALWDLHRNGMKSLVVDVRGNPGGLLTTAVQMCNKFVPSGTLVSTRGRDLSDNTVEYASHQRSWKVPLVVLVDGNSASASEIFAAAVQENSRGLIVGERTYGKGTVQTHFPLQTVSANLRLTTAQFFSPTGREMAGAGVEPDIRAEADPMSHRPHRRHEGELGRDHEFSRDRDFRHEGEFRHEEHAHHDGDFGGEDWQSRGERRPHEAAYRHGADFRSDGQTGRDPALEVAAEAATSPRAIELAQAAGSRRGSRPTERPLNN
jgi:carboxyl-terminal processing protease